MQTRVLQVALDEWLEEATPGSGGREDASTLLRPGAHSDLNPRAIPCVTVWRAQGVSAVQSPGSQPGSGTIGFVVGPASSPSLRLPSLRVKGLCPTLTLDLSFRDVPASLSHFRQKDSSPSSRESVRSSRQPPLLESLESPQKDCQARDISRQNLEDAFRCSE